MWAYFLKFFFSYCCPVICFSVCLFTHHFCVSANLFFFNFQGVIGQVKPDWLKKKEFSSFVQQTTYKFSNKQKTINKRTRDKKYLRFSTSKTGQRSQRRTVNLHETFVCVDKQPNIMKKKTFNTHRMQIYRIQLTTKK